jgi:hypothetical protein
MLIRGSPNGAAALVHAIHTPDAMVRNRWTPSIGAGVDVICRNRRSSSTGARRPRLPNEGYTRVGQRGSGHLAACSAVWRPA